MDRKIGMAAVLFVAILAAAAMLQSTNAVTYTVGDTTGWGVPSSNDFYENWADNKAFNVRDILVFNFSNGQHDVAKVSETAYDNCNTANTIFTNNSAPSIITLNETGNQYFICTIGNHCSRGQKLKIEVGDGTTASTPGSSPSPTTPTVTTSPPPPPSSASSLAATLSLVFTSVALVLFC